MVLPAERPHPSVNMTLPDAFDDDWSDASPEVVTVQPMLQPRAYQIEMFEQSMKQNIIVTVRQNLSLWFAG